MLPLEPHILIVCRYVTAWHPKIAKYGQDMSEVFIKFEVGVVFFKGTSILGYWQAKQNLKYRSRSEASEPSTLLKNTLLWIGSSSSDFSFH